MEFFAKAQPVWVRGKRFEKNVTAGFTAKVNAEKGQRVEVKITCSAYYHLYVNGVHAAYGPARCAHGFYRVDVLDLTEFVVPGENVIAAEVNCPNVNSFFWLNQPGFVQMEVSVGGEIAAFTEKTGETVLCCLSQHRVQKCERYSFQRPFCESYVLTPGWEDWKLGKNTEIMPQQPTPCVPLLERDFPAFRFPFIAPEKKVAEGEVFFDKNSTWHYAERHVQEEILACIGGYQRKELTESLSDELGAIKTVKNVPCEEFFCGKLNLKDGQAVILKFAGENCGFLTAKLNCREDATVYLCYDEILDENGDVNPLRFSIHAAVKLKMEKGQYDFLGADPVGVHYLKVVCIGGECEIENLGLLETASPVPITAKFEGKDAELMKIYAAAVANFRQNAFDVLTDCPTRERAGWTCDSFFTGRAEYAMTGKNESEKLLLQNYFLPESYPYLEKGQMPMCYPADHADHNFIPNWMLWLVLELEEYVGRCGDKQMLALAKPHVEEALEYFGRFENENGLLEKLPGWVFVEWSKCNDLTQDVNYPSSALYAGALEAVARLYDRPELFEKARKIREEIRKEALIDGHFHDRALRGEDGKLRVTEEVTETAQYYMFFFDVADLERDGALWDELVKEYAGFEKERISEDKMYPANAFIGKALRMLLFDRFGQKEELLSQIRTVYLPMAEKTGTLWENLTTHASCNHGFASVIGALLLKNA